ncbi:hypothetical protein ACFXPI_29930 [Streptomyces sp. NPDC059104]|uniref:hypothetical protein n=1 Tax=Streptomyces sp. NPDC059104 TaxID=3346729 RepID=UPI00367CEF17
MPPSRSGAPLRATRAAMFAAVCVALGALGHSSMSAGVIPFGWLMGAFVVTALLAWPATGRRCGPVGISAALLGVQGALHLAFSASDALTAGSAASRSPMPMAVPVTGAEPMPGHHHMPGMGTHASAAAADLAAGLSDGLATAGPATGGQAAGAMAGMADMTGMTGMADMAGHGAAWTAGLAHMAAMAGHGGLGMIAAHVLAGLFCAAWLARGEAAVFRLAGALGAATLHAARPLARALALVRTRVALVPAPPAHRPPYVRPRRLRGAVHAHTAVRRGPPGWRITRTTAPGLPARA